MSILSPYLQRRGDTFSFRIAVPSQLRHIIGKREFIQSLQTTDKRVAVVKALNLAATAKQLFFNLKRDMSNTDPEKLRKLVQEASHKYSRMVEREEHQQQIDEMERRHAEQLTKAKLQAENDAFKRALASFSASSGGSTTPAAKVAPTASASGPAPLLSAVVDGFLTTYPQSKKSAMFKKHRTVLPMLLQVVGDKPVDDLKQADINKFFTLLEKLPPRWADECRKRKLSIKQLAELTHPLAIGPKTFEDTYVACIRSFLKSAKKDWQDQGFPTTLTSEAIEYRGNREEGEKKQRALNQKELERLFNGPEMRAFQQNPAQAHYFWLPHIGLFTGARVNEICQINPQTDILQDGDTGIWYFWITEETDGDNRITKSTKNKVSRRKVPIHSTLQKLGFLEYVEQVKKQGAKLLFPPWKPMRGKASGQAEKWFRQLIKDTGLRDEKSGGRIVGMHAFRNTLLNRASNANPPVNAESITGHAGEKTAVVRGYEGELSLENKHRILESIPFGLDFS